jgi:MFS family permease
MIELRRNRWLVLSGCFISMALVFGCGWEPSSVFILPLVKHFKWTRAEVSTLNAALAIGAGAAGPMVGLLLERIGAAVCMAAGALLAGCGLGLASAGASLAGMVLSYFLIGAGMGFATIVPCNFVVANWFQRQRGVALGIIAAATSLFGMPMILLSNHIILLEGWRPAYKILSGLVFTAIPVVLLLVRSRPAEADREAAGHGIETAVTGLEAQEALATSSFWLLGFAMFGFWFAAAGWIIHSVSYLVSLGYSSTQASLALSVIYILGTIGKLTIPVIAERFGARRVTVFDIGLLGVGQVFLLFANHWPMLILHLAIAGIVCGAPMALLAMVQLESLGLKHFGTISGLLSLAYTAGFSIGPVFAGRIFDASLSYRPALALFALMMFACSAAIAGCAPLAENEAGTVARSRHPAVSRRSA